MEVNTRGMVAGRGGGVVHVCGGVHKQDLLWVRGEMEGGGGGKNIFKAAPIRIIMYLSGLYTEILRLDKRGEGERMTQGGKPYTCLGGENDTQRGESGKAEKVLWKRLTIILAIIW